MIAIKLPKEQKEEIVKRVQAYFEEERSETIGVLAAEQLTDFMLKELAPYLYNKAIADVRGLLAEKFGQIEDELYAMEKPIRR
jgi:uncharacterized protein (DUF2164 family)